MEYLPENWSNQLTIEVAVRYLPLLKYLQNKNIDLCRFGTLPLEVLAQQKNLSLSEIRACLLNALPPTQQDSMAHWRKAPCLSRLIERIEQVFHRSLSRELREIEQLFQIVLENHGETSADYADLHLAYHELALSTQAHMNTEEENIFPVMRFLDYCFQKSQPLPVLPGGSIQDLIDRLEHEHVYAEKKMLSFKDLSNNFSRLSDECPVVKLIYTRIIHMEQSLKDHIFVENQILNPMALKIENHLRALA